MARVTVEDCVTRVPNRFELVILAAQRAREIVAGAALTVDRDRDRNPVVALREIAELTVDLDGLRDEKVRSLQKHVKLEEPEEDILELVEQEQQHAAEVGEATPAEEIAEDLLSVDEGSVKLASLGEAEALPEETEAEVTPKEVEAEVTPEETEAEVTPEETEAPSEETEDEALPEIKEEEEVVDQDKT